MVDRLDPGPPNNGKETDPREPDEQVYFEGSPLLRGHVGMVLTWFGIATGLMAVSIVIAASGIGWIAGAIGIPIAFALLLIPILQLRTVRYRITNYRIDYERGLLTRKIDTLELWHVDDISMRQGPIDRMLNVGTISVDSGDNSTPRLVLRGLPMPRQLFESLKQRVLAVKRQRGVIKMDLG